MLNNHVEKDIFQKAFQKLIYTYCVPLVDLCELSYIYEYKDVYGSDDFDFILDKEYDMAIKKYGRVFKRFCVKQYSSNSAGFLIKEPKIYDQFMRESQTSLYNEFATLIGYDIIEKHLPSSLIKDASHLDGAIPDNDIITKLYPYYLTEERKGVNFLEYILLINVYVSFHHRSLFAINNLQNSTKAIEQTKKMVDTLIEHMNSKEMFPFYVHIIFDIFELVTSELHNKKAERYIRVAWLPEKLKNRVDAFRAFERHKKNKIKISTEKYEISQFENILTSNNAYDHMNMFRSMSDYNTVELMGSTVLPLSFKILMKVCETEEHSAEYLLALEYAEIIKNYIFKSISEVEKILKKLYSLTV